MKPATTTVVRLTCINCPLGCELDVKIAPDGGVESVTGNDCGRGPAYAATETANPVRTLTSTVRVAGACVAALPVKTSAPVPKAKILELAAALKDVSVAAPVRCGDVIVEDFGGAGVSLVATRSLERFQQ